MNKLLLSLLLVLFLLPRVALAETAASDWKNQPEIGVRLLSGVTAVGEGETVPLGLEIAMKPGWKTYWRFPGAAGYPAKLDGAGSQNLADLTIHWPAPQRFNYEGMETFGYDGHVILPITAKLVTMGQALSLKVAVDLMTCEHICIPYTFALTLDVPMGAAQRSSFADTMDAWQKRLPVQGIVSSPWLDGDKLVIPVDGLTSRKPDVFIEAPDAWTVGTPVLASGVFTAPVKGKASLSGQKVTLTLVDGTRAIEQTVTVQERLNSAPPPVSPSVSLLKALVAAFIGGLILNLMPCVLPVLSLKLLSVVSHGQSPPAHVRASFLASAAGILTSFLVLAGVAIAFKQAGAAVGWGVQFQNPVFLSVLVLILTLFAASLWNLIEIPLPRVVADAINDRLPMPGEHDRTLVGNFLTGAFTTVLATPCSAPFVGTALGFALAGGAVEILSVAVAMGLGLALPFLLVAAFPQVARVLPRPGRWMNWLRGAFGIALTLTALWLASILADGLPAFPGLLVRGSVFSLLGVLWLRASMKRPMLLVKGIVALTLSWIVLHYGIDRYERAHMVTADFGMNWVLFDEASIPGLVASGKVVFVDVTADWCLTCKANEKLVLDTEPTLSRLRAADVVTMRADWTHPNPVIGDYLKKFGRYGIPFNIVYGKAAPQGIALPELLTADAVEEALEKARGD